MIVALKLIHIICYHKSCDLSISSSGSLAAPSRDQPPGPRNGTPRHSFASKRLYWHFPFSKTYFTCIFKGGRNRNKILLCYSFSYQDTRLLLIFSYLLECYFKQNQYFFTVIHRRDCPVQTLHPAEFVSGLYDSQALCGSLAYDSPWFYYCLILLIRI